MVQSFTGWSLGPELRMRKYLTDTAVVTPLPRPAPNWAVATLVTKLASHRIMQSLFSLIGPSAVNQDIAGFTTVQFVWAITKGCRSV